MKIAILSLGIGLSFGANASVCNINDVEGILLSLNGAAQKYSSYQVRSELIDLKRKVGALESVTNIEVGYEQSLEEKEKELSLAVEFDIEKIRKRKSRQALNDLNAKAEGFSTQKELADLTGELFNGYVAKIQGEYFLKEIEQLKNVIHQAENQIKAKSLKDSNDRVTLNNLNLLKKSLEIKSLNLKTKNRTNSLLLEQYAAELGDCKVDLKKISQLLESYNPSSINQKNDSALELTKINYDLALAEADFEQGYFLPNLKLSPFAKREMEAKNYSVGLNVSFDFFNTSSSFAKKWEVSQAYGREMLRINKSEVDFQRKKQKNEIENLQDKLKVTSDLHKSEEELKNIKNLFDRGLISSLVYLESLRSYLDLQEEVLETRLELVTEIGKYYGSFGYENIK